MYFALTGLTSTSIYKQVNTYPLKNYIPSLCQGLFFIKGVDGEYDSFVVFLILVASLSIFLKNNPTSEDPTFVWIFHCWHVVNDDETWRQITQLSIHCLLICYTQWIHFPQQLLLLIALQRAAVVISINAFLSFIKYGAPHGVLSMASVVVGV